MFLCPRLLYISGTDSVAKENTHTHTNTRTHTHIHAHTHMHTHTNTRTHAHAHARAHTHARTHTRIWKTVDVTSILTKAFLWVFTERWVHAARYFWNLSERRIRVAQKAVSSLPRILERDWFCISLSYTRVLFFVYPVHSFLNRRNQRFYSSSLRSNNNCYKFNMFHTCALNK